MAGYHDLPWIYVFRPMPVCRSIMYPLPLFRRVQTRI